MKISITFVAFLLTFFTNTFAQPVIYQECSDTPLGSYSNIQFVSWEEIVMLKPPGPCKVNKIYIALAGTTPKLDTVWIVGDPAEGATVPSEFVWGINTYTNRIINHQGQTVWYEMDVSNDNIRADGISSIIIQHVIKRDGPWFLTDNQQQKQPYHSWLLDVWRPWEPYNIYGVYRSSTLGNYMAKMEVEYEFPEGNTSAPPPPPTLVDKTKDAGLVDNQNNPFKSEIVSVADWNNDGLDDIAIRTNFFQNNGNGTFTKINDKMNNIQGLTVWADADNDGYIDCFALNGWKNDKMYWGKPDGTFEEDTDPTLQLDAPSVTPIWLDYDHDGLLDLFIAYGRKEVSGQETYYPDQLFKNLGNRKFKNVTEEAGISAGEPPPYYDCWGASACDFNNDGWTDIFVATYRLAPDLLFVNLGDGTFAEMGQVIGVHGIPTYSPSTFGHGMGSDWGDYDNDGYVDLAVGNLGHPDSRGLFSNPSLIFHNDGPPDFLYSDTKKQLGLKFFEMNAGLCWLDLNQDGYQDIFHCQYSYDAKGAGTDRYSRVYLNEGPDKQFNLKDVTWELGSYIHGAWSPVRLDYDNDGSMDLLVASNQENVKLFHNKLKNRGNWISFRVKGSPENKVPNDAFGSSITVHSGQKLFYRSLPGSIMNARASQSSNELHFGLGQINVIDSVIIKYPNGNKQKLTNLQVNKKYYIEYINTDVSEKIISSDWQISDITPNPASQSISFIVKSPSSTPVTISIYDIKGNKIEDICCNEIISTEKAFSLNISNFNCGKYIIWLKTDKVSSIKTFIKI